MTASLTNPRTASLVACLERLIAADVAGADRVLVDRLVQMSQRLRGFLDAVDVELAARAGELAKSGSVLSVAEVLSNHGRCSKRDARKAAARAEACEAVPGLVDALSSGTASAGHVDAVVSATAGLDADQKARFAEHAGEVVDAAARLPVEQFCREVRRLADNVSRAPGESRQQRLHRRRCVKRWVDPVTGMSVTHLELDAEADAKVWTAIRAGLEGERERTEGNDVRTLDQQLADVVVGLITGSQSLDQRAPEVSVLIDHETLRHGPHDDAGGSTSETSDGDPIEVDTVRRLGCDGDLVGILLGERGVPLAVGRARRLATREQRQAARAMYRSCGFPGCTVPFDWCRLHHVAWWTRDRGPTDFDNLLPLCGLHHHLVHEGGWVLALDPDRTVTVRRPDGSVFFTGDTTNRRHRPTEPILRDEHPERLHLEPGEPGYLDQLSADLARSFHDAIVRTGTREHPPP